MLEMLLCLIEVIIPLRNSFRLVYELRVYLSLFSLYFSGSDGSKFIVEHGDVFTKRNSFKGYTTHTSGRRLHYGSTSGRGRFFRRKTDV